MGHTVDLLLVLSALCWVAQGDTQAVGCPDGIGQEIISKNPSLLNTDDITASSARTSWPAANLVNFDFSTQSPWCTQETADPKPALSLTFSQPVVMTGLLSGGYTYSTGGLEYVTNFTLSGLDSGETLEFAVPQINLFFPFYPPIVAESLHLTVLDYQVRTGDICWALAIFGCPLPERDTSSTSTVLVTTTVSTSKLTFSPTPSSIPVAPTSSPSVGMGPSVEQSSSERVRVEKDYMAVAIVLPVAFITIIIVAIIVAVGVFLYAKNGSVKWSPYSRHRASTDVTVRVIDNAELYQPGTVVQTEEVKVALSGPSSSQGQDLSGGDTVYESVVPQTGDMLEDEDGLRYNPMYGASGEHDEHGVKVLMNDCYGSTSAEGTADYAYPSVTVPNASTGRVNPYEATPF